jgi:outer membrane protein
LRPQKAIQPYLGVGGAYAILEAEDSPFPSLDYSDGAGFALGAGIDYVFGDRWLINIDAKKLWLNTDIDINTTESFGVITGPDADADVDPLIIRAGFGIKF